jgi:hypothetical protein
MVKYYHCERCKRIYNTETWIGEVHLYDGVCSSCNAEEQQKGQIQQENVDTQTENKVINEQAETLNVIREATRASPIELEKELLLRLEQMANDVLSNQGSIDVLIKEIKIGLVDKAKERIDETIQSFDVSRIEAQKVITYVEKTFEYLSEYKNYMDDVAKKLQDKPKMKVKPALEKVFKESMTKLPKNIAKDALLNKKTMLKNVFGKAQKWFNIYSDIEDVNELTKKMVLHPFNEIQKKLRTLPFYN